MLAASPILLVASDRLWLEALSLELEAANLLAVPARTLADAVERLRGARPLMAVIDGTMYDPALGDLPSGLTALQIAVRLRADRVELPILFVTAGSVPVLSNLAAGSKQIEVLENAAVTPTMVLERIGYLTGSVATPRGPIDWAMVEINIETEKVHFRLTLSNGEILLDNPVESNLRAFLEDWQAEFRTWRLYELRTGGGRTLRDRWRERLSIVGERLHQQLISDPQRTALEECLTRVRSMDDIHFRFSLYDQMFPDVPFETFRDKVRKRFLRELSPVARRIMLQPGEHLHNPLSDSETDRCVTKATKRVLFIRSDVDGVFRAGSHTFGDRQELMVPHLNQLAKEYGELYRCRRNHALTRPHICNLKPGLDCLKKLEGVLRAGPWDIVHYSGHSASADDGEVFFILPGAIYGSTVPLRAADFARMARDGRAQLVIMSCCESSSPQALFVLAQERIPTSIGFRWEVDAAEAAQFVCELHEGLAQGRPVGRAFHRAVCALTPDRPTFVSPILLAQSTSWAHPDV